MDFWLGIGVRVGVEEVLCDALRRSAFEHFQGFSPFLPGSLVLVVMLAADDVKRNFLLSLFPREVVLALIPRLASRPAQFSFKSFHDARFIGHTGRSVRDLGPVSLDGQRLKVSHGLLVARHGAAKPAGLRDWRLGTTFGLVRE